MLFEGEEETGSPSLPAFLAKNAKTLKADLLLVCDTRCGTPRRRRSPPCCAAWCSRRSSSTAANRDLHSGLYGGAAINPIRVLARIIADLHDANGAVTLPGFYDGVEELPEEVAEQWRDLDFDDAEFLGEVGLSVPAGEKGRSTLEMIWSRPTCDVNGIVGGYTGEGTKTVLPAKASAKVSFRLVGKQNPGAHRRKRSAPSSRRACPPTSRPSSSRTARSPAIALSVARRGAAPRAAARWRPNGASRPALVGSGGSIPIVGAFKRELGMDSLMVGFGLDDDAIHSPNEKYERSSFHKGARSWARILAALAA